MTSGTDDDDVIRLLRRVPLEVEQGLDELVHGSRSSSSWA